jgi:hypothetical protein
MKAMVGAEILKLRRNRGLMAFALVLTLGVIVLFFGYNAVEHASDPATYAPAGGTHRFARAVGVLGLWFGMLTATLIGGEAGTADIASGVFRDLVATGRSRLKLFAVRVPGALVVTLAFTMSAFLVAVAATFLFADGAATPSLELILQAAGWLALANGVAATVAVGVGSLTGSRALTLTGVIGWSTVVTQLLLNLGSLGSARDGLLAAALNQLIPVDRPLQITMASGVAVAVVAAWALLSGAIGAWRTARRDA